MLACYNSKRDIHGNCYWAFRWTNTKTGKSVVGTICGGESNISAIVREMGLTWETCHYAQQELPIRQFNHMVKEWKYAGCRPEELATFIKNGLKH